MAFERFSYTKSWEDAAAFPTYEPDEKKVRADLQQLHDEAKDGINRLIDALNATTAAAQLPFAPVAGMTAQTVQTAIEEVFAAVTNAAAGKIVNGSVTKEKLEAELLKRIYGGRVWLSMDAPGEKDNPQTDFPVGQLWLRPACTVTNLAGAWEVFGGTAEAQDGGWCFVTDGTQDYLTASQELEGVGAAGQRVLVCLKLGETDSHINGLRISLNGLVQEIEEGGWFETELDQTGGLELQINAEWPDAEEGSIVEITTLVVVNTDAAERAAGDCAPCSDWPGRLEPLGAFAEAAFPTELWLQTAPGNWEQICRTVQPVSGGGTGLSHVQKGALLYGTGEEALAALAPVENGILQWTDGAPHSVAPRSFAKNNRFPYILTGEYVGNGGATEEADGTVKTTLPMESEDAKLLKFLLIYPVDGSCDTALVANGGRHSGSYSFYDGVLVTYLAWVSLNGRVLTFSNEERGNYKGQMVSQHMNAAGTTYRWIAVCGGEATAEGGEAA